MKFPLAMLLLTVLMMPGPYSAWSKDRPNVILIMCDDLNGYVEGFDGHPQTQTPNLSKLGRTGVRFVQAHCNIPICGPSRASMFTGIYPHHSGCYGFTKWDGYPTLAHSRTLMDYFRENGYQTLGTGKLMHQLVRTEWDEYGWIADYGPFANDGSGRVAHPDVPAPFREIGAIDGSFGPLVNISDRTFDDGKSYYWTTGSWRGVSKLRVDAQDDRDPTADEKNCDWAVENLNRLANSHREQPFFMGVGFVRPHTPLIVPQKYFDLFPVEQVHLPRIKETDVQDTHARSIRGVANEKEPNSERTMDMGSRLFDDLVASYDSRDQALKHFVQAYLASVASVDELIGRILNVVDETGLADNTIIIVTSDHGWGMGEKDYLYKNSLWQESTRVPLLIRAPGVSQPGGVVDHPVSLIDVYPTLIELCGLKGETMKNSKGHALDGFSLSPFLADPQSTKWEGPEAVLTALYKWRMSYEPAKENYSLRSKDWRYIRYENGLEELYQTSQDPYEWNNLAEEEAFGTDLIQWRKRLLNRIPTESDPIPPQPRFKPKQKQAANSNKDGNATLSAAAWKDDYFRKHPDADSNEDGELSWPELKAHRDKR